MRHRTGDLLAAPIVALWAVMSLPMWRAAGRLLTGGDSMLFLFEGIAGMAVFAAAALLAFGALGIAVGLVMGVDAARLQALVVGCVSGLGALTVALGGGVPSASGHPWAISAWLLGLIGGPVVVSLIIAGGELLPPPRRRRPAPTTLMADTSPAPPPVTATSEDYWLQVANRPAPLPSELPDDPWWSDLDTVGWLLFAVCAGAILLGVYWFGGRWHRGPHPLAGALLIASAIGVGWLMDRARRQARR